MDTSDTCSHSVVNPYEINNTVEIIYNGNDYNKVPVTTNSIVSPTKLLCVNVFFYNEMNHVAPSISL